MRSAPVWAGSTTLFGPGLEQFAFGAWQFAAGDDFQPRVQASGAQRDEDVRRVVRQDGRQCPCIHDAGGLQGFLVGRIGLDAQVTEVTGEGDRGVRLLQHDDGDAAGLQFLRQHQADPAEAAYDDVVPQAVDLCVHALEPEYLMWSEAVAMVWRAACRRV